MREASRKNARRVSQIAHKSERAGYALQLNYFFRSGYFYINTFASHQPQKPLCAFSIFLIFVNVFFTIITTAH